MLRPAAITIALSMSSLLPVPAQTAHVLARGDKVRLQVDLPYQQIVGTLISLDSDTLRVVPDYGATVAGKSPTVAVPRRSIRLAEIRVPGHSHAGKGAAIGLAVGALVGGGLAYAATPGCSPDEWCIVDPKTDAAAAGVLIGGLVGAGVGAIAGASSRERWEPATLTAGSQ
ncbi:MAG TPA: hypothetical protein VLT79_09960 [Gemmatimonadales bacterium]|nr:hypothetical protein [Gemmatimonadales bacterium]